MAVYRCINPFTDHTGKHYNQFDKVQQFEYDKFEQGEQVNFQKQEEMTNQVRVTPSAPSEEDMEVVRKRLG